MVKVPLLSGLLVSSRKVPCRNAEYSGIFRDLGITSPSGIFGNIGENWVPGEAGLAMATAERCFHLRGACICELLL